MSEGSDWITDHGDIVDAIRGLEEGERVHVRTVGSYPDRTLNVLPDDAHPTPLGEASIAVDGNRQRFLIEALYSHGLESLPWLRRDGESAGEIDAVRVEKYPSDQ